jgi:hypothetical protein
MLKSNATLKERLKGWVSWDSACYDIGVCLGFWPDFGAPQDNDPWHGMKDIIWSANQLGDSIAYFLDSLVEEGMLERREDNDIEFRWNPNYKGLDNE